MFGEILVELEHDVAGKDIEAVGFCVEEDRWTCDTQVGEEAVFEGRVVGVAGIEQMVVHVFAFALRIFYCFHKGCDLDEIRSCTAYDTDVHV